MIREVIILHQEIASRNLLTEDFSSLDEFAKHLTLTLPKEYEKMANEQFKDRANSSREIKSENNLPTSNEQTNKRKFLEVKSEIVYQPFAKKIRIPNKNIKIKSSPNCH